MIERLKYINIIPALDFIQQFILSFGFIMVLILCGISCYECAVWVASSIIVSAVCLYFYKWVDNKISMEL